VAEADAGSRLNIALTDGLATDFEITVDAPLSERRPPGRR
jgi:hypothetical protein